jgi:hypothetical protein
MWVDQHNTGLISLTFPSVSALWGITFGLFRGLFILSPWLLFSIPGIVIWWKKGQQRPEWMVVFASILSMYLFNASSGMWWGGFSIGPRYFLPALPFLVVPVGYAIESWKDKLWLWISLIFSMIWSLIAVWGLSLAGQSFPSDSIYNPLIEYALPNWEHDQIARNIGTILNFDGWTSLILLFILWGILGSIWWILVRKQGIKRGPGLVS